MSRYRVNICSFSAVDDLPRKVSYETFREAVLKAGRFSVFEATETSAKAALFTRLSRDPKVQLVPLAFPWTKVVRAP